MGGNITTSTSDTGSKFDNRQAEMSTGQNVEYLNPAISSRLRGSFAFVSAEGGYVRGLLRGGKGSQGQKQAEYIILTLFFVSNTSKYLHKIALGNVGVAKVEFHLSPDVVEEFLLPFPVRHIIYIY